MSAMADVRMREEDAFSWTMEQDPLLRMTIVAMAVLDRAPDWDRLTARMERLTRAVPQFRQRVVEAPWHLAAPKWVIDPGFDLSWHMRRVSAPPDADLPEVLDFARQLGTAAFDPARALWECTVVAGLAGGRAVLIVKVHHMLTDGVGGMQLLLHVFDIDPAGTDLGPMPPLPPAGHPDSATVRDALAADSKLLLSFARGTATETLRAALHASRHPLGTASSLFATARSVAEVIEPTNEALSPVTVSRGLGRRYEMIDVALDDLKNAGTAAGGTLNDAFVASVLGGLRIYHERHGRPVRELRGVLPINTRAPNHPPAGNRIALVRYLAPAGVSDPRRRIQVVGERAEHWKHARALKHMEGISLAINRLPASYLQGLAKHNDFVASNVPGFSFPVYCSGAPVAGLYAFSPTGGAAVQATLISYHGVCHIGVNIDTAAVHDTDLLIHCMGSGFEEVLALTGQHAPVRLPARQPPGAAS